ncbi:MAG TPA: hypothetical protein VHZ78_09250 [Rhizomicrobium sp.]|nr:hypothetical protein [Rhizomicrobium sp.]
MTVPQALFAACAANLLLVACASDSAAPSDIVRDETAAIRIAKTDCDDYCERNSEGRWHAKLRDGKWRVVFHISGDRPNCDAYKVSIDAVTGKAIDGEMCVTTD